MCVCQVAGLTAAALGADMTLTDLPAALPLLTRNLERNSALVDAAGGRVRTVAL